MRTFSALFACLASKAATGTGVAFECTDYRHVIAQVATSGTATATIKFQGSLSETPPDFSAAASKSNPWTYLDIVDLATNNVIAGATGVAYAGADAVNMVEINTNGMTWVCATVTAWTQGSIDVNLRGFDNS